MRIFVRLCLFVCLAAVTAVLVGGQVARAADVDLALVLAIDCSYSVDSSEYGLQISGLAAALRHPKIHQAIASGPNKRIAITVVQWANSATQVPVMPWRIIQSPQSALLLASHIEALPRVVSGGGTSISAMLRFGFKMLETAPFTADRRAIDLVSDGRNNSGVSPRMIRRYIANNGVTINGLTILNEVKTLDLYFEDNVIAGPGRFVMVADSYSQFAKAIYRKLRREISRTGTSDLTPKLRPDHQLAWRSEQN
jgi:hypothetical protein